MMKSTVISSAIIIGNKIFDKIRGWVIEMVSFMSIRKGHPFEDRDELSEARDGASMLLCLI